MHVLKFKIIHRDDNKQSKIIKHVLHVRVYVKLFSKKKESIFGVFRSRVKKKTLQFYFLSFFRQLKAIIILTRNIFKKR